MMPTVDYLSLAVQYVHHHHHHWVFLGLFDLPLCTLMNTLNKAHQLALFQMVNNMCYKTKLDLLQSKT